MFQYRIKYQNSICFRSSLLTGTLTVLILYSVLEYSAQFILFLECDRDCYPSLS